MNQSFLTMESVGPVIELPAGESAHLRLVGRIGQAARTAGHEDAYLAWLHMRWALSKEDGRGWNETTAVSSDIMADGDGLFWEVSEKQSRIYLRSPRRVMEAFEAMALARVDVAAGQAGVF